MGLLQWELLGYGLYRAWILEHMAFARSFQAQSAVSSDALANLPLWTLYLAISASAATFFFLQKACRTRLLEELVPDCMAACGLIGSSCVAFAAVSGNNEVLLAGFALAGLSGGFFEVKWSLYFLRLAKGAVYCNFLLAILLSSVCGIFTSAILPPEAFFATALSLFVGMAFLERMAKERNRKLGQDDGWTHIGALSPEADSSMGEKGRNTRKVFRRIVFASALYCVVHVSAITLCAASAPNDHFIRHLANFAAVGILLALFLAKGTLASIELSKFVLPLTAAGLFLLLIDARYLGDAAHFLLCFSNKLFEILIWVLVIDFIGVLSVSAAAAFGGIVAARNIGSFIGSLLSLSVLSMVPMLRIGRGLFPRSRCSPSSRCYGCSRKRHFSTRSTGSMHLRSFKQTRAPRIPQSKHCSTSLVSENSLLAKSMCSCFWSGGRIAQQSLRSSAFHKTPRIRISCTFTKSSMCTTSRNSSR